MKSALNHHIIVGLALALFTVSVSVGCGDGKKGSRSRFQKVNPSQKNRGGDTPGGQNGGGTTATPPPAVATDTDVTRKNAEIEALAGALDQSGRKIMLSELPDGEYALEGVSTRLIYFEKSEHIELFRKSSIGTLADGGSAIQEVESVSAGIFADHADSGLQIDVLTKFTSESGVVSGRVSDTFSSKAVNGKLQDDFAAALTEAYGATSVDQLLNTQAGSDTSTPYSDGANTALGLRLRDDGKLVIKVRVSENTHYQGTADETFNQSREVFLTYGFTAKEQQQPTEQTVIE
jgi:hypothetical protein